MEIKKSAPITEITVSTDRTPKPYNASPTPVEGVGTPTTGSNRPLEGSPLNPQAPAGTPAAPSQPDAALQQFKRKEMALRQQARQLQADKAKWEAEKAQVKPGMSQEEWKAKFLKDPGEVGLSYEEMATRYLNQPSTEDQRFAAQERRIAELEAEVKKASTKIDETQGNAYKSALKQVDNDVKKLLQGNDKYELINAQRAQDQVTAYIDLTYKEDEVLLSAEEAADHIEDYLVEQALALTKLKKIQSKSGVSTPSGEQPQKTEQSGQTPKSATLTHQMGQGATRPLSRRDRAIAVMMGQKLPGT